MSIVSDIQAPGGAPASRTERSKGGGAVSPTALVLSDLVFLSDGQTLTVGQTVSLSDLLRHLLVRNPPPASPPLRQRLRLASSYRLDAAAQLTSRERLKLRKL